MIPTVPRRSAWGMAETDIRWAPAPIARREQIPARLLEALTREELLDFALAAQADIDALRVALHRALEALAGVTAERDRMRAVVRRGRR